MADGSEVLQDLMKPREVLINHGGILFNDPDTPQEEREPAPYVVVPELEGVLLKDARREMETNELPWTDNNNWAEICDELRKRIILSALKKAENSVTGGSPTDAALFLQVVHDATNTDALNELLQAATR